MTPVSFPVDLLEELAQAHGAPGAEDGARRVVARRLAGFRQATDGLGNLAVFGDGPENGPVVALAGHLDEVGFAVQNITADGFLQFVPLGGWWSHTLPSQRVRVRNSRGEEIIGVITSVPPHFLGDDARTRVVPLEKLYIDVGARDRRQVVEEFLIALGDPVVPDAGFLRMRNPDLVMSKAFDNRVGMAVAVQALLDSRGLSLPCRPAVIATVQEELGTRGARTAGALVKPDVVLVLEGPPADDTPGSPPGEAQGRLGAGVQIRVMDPSAVMNRGLVALARDLAASGGIPFQLTVRRSGGTDAAAFQHAGNGTPVIVLGIPARYIHTHNSIVHLSDCQAALRLVLDLLKRLDADTVKSLTAF